MKTAIIVLSMLSSVSAFANVSYKCDEVQGRRGSESFFLTDAPGNEWDYTTESRGDMHQAGHLRISPRAALIRGYSSFSGLVGFVAERRGVMTPKVVRDQTIYISRELQNGQVRGTALKDARTYNCAMLMTRNDDRRDDRRDDRNDGRRDDRRGGHPHP